MESQVSGLAKLDRKVSELAKFGLGKLLDLPNFNQESHDMRVTCIIILIILQAAYNILHISYHVVHIILSYAMRPSNHGLDIRTSQNECSTYGTSTREPSLTKTESASLFIRTSFSFFHILVQPQVIPRMQFKTLIRFAVQ